MGSYRSHKTEDDRPKEFGERITADHLVAHSEDSEGITGDKDAFIIGDLHSEWIYGYPVNSRDTDDTYACFTHFLGPDMVMGHLYSDSSKEIEAAAKSLGVPHTQATPGMHRTNAKAESHVKIVLRGTRTLLCQAGLPHAYWPFAMRCFCFGRIIKQHKFTSIWQLRHGGDPFHGLVIPFGALVYFMQTPAKLEKQAKASQRLVPGIFLYHFLQPGGLWKGEYVVIPITHFAGKELSYDAKHGKIKPQRVKEVKILSDDWVFSP